MGNFEFQPGKSTEEVIDEVMEDLDRGLYNNEERVKVEAKLEAVRVTTFPDSPERQKIDELLKDIRDRYGE